MSTQYPIFIMIPPGKQNVYSEQLIQIKKQNCWFMSGHPENILSLVSKLEFVQGRIQNSGLEFFL